MILGAFWPSSGAMAYEKKEDLTSLDKYMLKSAAEMGMGMKGEGMEVGEEMESSESSAEE